MLKKLLFTAIITCISIAVNSQSFHATGTFYVSGLASQNRLEAELAIENTTLNDIAVLVDRDNSQLNPNHRSYYCWAECYDTTVSLATLSQVLYAETIDSSSFHGYIYTFNQPGVSTVTYKFFDEHDPSDLIFATIVYDILPTGIEQPSFSNPMITISPNPSSTFAAISISLPENSTGTLVISDYTGKIIREVALKNKLSMQLISTTDMSAGVYYCTVKTANGFFKTEKLVVAQH